VTVPATVGALTGRGEADAAKDAEDGAYLTRAIPGGKDRAREVISVAKGIYNRLIEKGAE